MGPAGLPDPPREDVVGRVTDQETVTIGLVAHYQFCPRRAWLEACGEQTDTWQMAVGVSKHAASDTADLSNQARIRAVEVSHDEWGYTGRCDSVETRPDGALWVVECKSTPVRRRAEVTPPMVTQLTLQVAALESMGHSIAGQSIWFVDHRRRVDVRITEADRRQARQLVRETLRTVESAVAPAPLEDDARCKACSHIAVCMPDERTLAPVRRRIVVANPDSQVVHLATPGSRAYIRSGRIVVVKGDEKLTSAPIERVQGVVVHGNIDLSGGLIRELLWRQLAVVWCTSSGKVVGWAKSGRSPNGAMRVEQHVQSARGRLDLAREFVGAKIHNQATLLRRNGDPGKALVTMRELSRLASRATSVPELFGLEGEAAALYFERFGTMLRDKDLAFDVRTRPARDPVNAALNYSYALLLGDMLRAVSACGLDPHAGFLHSSTRNKPAFALDICEEFRSPIADSTVVRAFNNGELRASDFRTNLDSVVLTEKGRRAVIAAYEQRVTGEFIHPTFGYRVSWRRAMEIQARLVLGVLDGTQPAYVGIRVR